MQRPACPVLFATVVIATLAGCRAAPSKVEALDAIRATSPGLETTTAFARVWQDGPAWFSCAEILSKIGSKADARVVYDQVGNWRPLVVAGWLVLRDTAHGVVSDPGWCAGKLADEEARRASGWTRVIGDTFPTGTARRGWSVSIGHPHLAVLSTPKRIGPDSAMVDYVATVQTNMNGAAVGADRDSAFAVALLRRVDGRWRVAATSPKGSVVAPGVMR